MDSRRSFMRRFGAGASAAVASVAGVARGEAKGDAPRADGAALRLALLEEEKRLRQLHQRFEQAMDKRLYDEVIGMFVDDAEVVFNGGVFRGRSGVARLYRDHFGAWKTGVRMEPAPGFELASGQQQDTVEVSPDLRSAKAAFPYSIKVGMPFETESSLAAMARLHGEGVKTWWEGGQYNASYRKDAAGAWRISRLEYGTLSRADWRQGRSYALPMAASPFSVCFPLDAQGPDALV